jgi:hypothetical protein
MEQRMIKELLTSPQLSESKRQFIQGLNKYFKANKNLSERQLTALRGIYEEQ